MVAGDASGGGDGAGRQNELADAIARCPKPVIGAINGFAITGGFELALAGLRTEQMVLDTLPRARELTVALLEVAVRRLQLAVGTLQLGVGRDDADHALADHSG